MKLCMILILLYFNIIFAQKGDGVNEFFKINNIELLGVNDTNNIDPYSFFPLKVGNFWQYSEQGGFISEQLVTYDSLMDDESHIIYLNNHEKRWVQWPDYRIDINYSVYFDPNDWNRLYYKLDAKIGERWWIYKDSIDGEFVQGFIAEVDTIYSGYYLGKNTTFKVISNYLEYNNMGRIDEYWDSDRVLAAGMGLVYEDKDGIQPNILISAIIDGDTLGTIVDVNDKTYTNIPKELELFHNYPNPFNPITNINYSIPSNDVYVRLVIYDVLGREIEVLMDEIKNVGNYRISFDGSNLSSGVYFYRIQSGKFNQVNKMLLLK